VKFWLRPSSRRPERSRKWLCIGKRPCRKRDDYGDGHTIRRRLNVLDCRRSVAVGSGSLLGEIGFRKISFADFRSSRGSVSQGMVVASQVRLRLVSHEVVQTKSDLARGWN